LSSPLSQVPFVREAWSPCLQQKEKNITTQPIKGFSREGPVAAGSPPPSMSSVMKNNPLYTDLSLEEAMEERKKNPSWTIEEYDKHSLHKNLSGHLKVPRLMAFFNW
jgi:hypothetical protein